MKQCKCFGNKNDIVKWEAPDTKGTFLHICTRCGHAALAADPESFPVHAAADWKEQATATC